MIVVAVCFFGAQICLSNIALNFWILKIILKFRQLFFNPLFVCIFTVSVRIFSNWRWPSSCRLVAATVAALVGGRTKKNVSFWINLIIFCKILSKFFSLDCLYAAGSLACSCIFCCFYFYYLFFFLFFQATIG